MRNESRSIFRVEALQLYTESKERSVMPRFTSPRSMLFLWIVMGLLMASGIAFLLIRVPVQVSGVAVVVDSISAQSVPHNATMVVFLPAKILPELRVGQTVTWRFDGAKDRVSRTLIAVEPHANSPSALRGRFPFTGTAAAAINQPMAVAFARLEPVLEGEPAATYAGSVYRVEVEVGRRRVVSFLPVIGSLFRE